jgi:carbamate kinase
VATRVECIAGDFFEKVPSGADAYVMKHILHDWNDADSVRILKSIHAAAAPNTKLLLVEAILEEGNGPQFAKLLDIEMLVMTPGGHERTLAQWQRLLETSGYRFTRVVPTPSPVAVIEAVRV